MAQFVTHIQPTLVESSHHYVPHPHHHKDHHEKHHKETAESTSKEHHHGKDKHGKHHHVKSGPHMLQHFPVLPSTPGRCEEHVDYERKRDSGQYLDSHGIPHVYQLHFIDSQGIHRDYHGYAEDSSDIPKQEHEKELHYEEVVMRKAVFEDRSPFEKSPSNDDKRPIPPQFIHLQSVYSTENKYRPSDGNKSFLLAARNGQLDKVLEHLKSNIDINSSNSNGLNALHLASKDGHVEIVKELLKRGALVDAATKKGNTALHIASLAGQEEVVKLLVQHGATVNVQSQNGFTPLYMAAQENHDNVVRYLLANGAKQTLSTEDGFTPLAVAMQQGHDKVVTVLLENDTRGKVRLPALHIAAKKDDVKAAKLLLENEHNPDVTSKSGFTPLHIASHYGNQQIAHLLIEKGADVNYIAKHNITPLHVAAKWGKSEMVALLLGAGATIDAKTRDGLTPLHCAARSGHEQVVDKLLEKGAPISSKTKNGLAPLHMAAQGDHIDAARILLYHRAPVDEVTVDYLTALHVAAHCGHVRVAKLLLDRQADPNARALNGFTPLHIACKKNRIKVVELLLKHGASIGATTESGLTPLHVASFMGCMNIVIYLLQHDANPDASTIRGETPLHLAARANQTDIIRILLRNGAQVDARAREQQTPLHIASRLGNMDIVMLLLQHGSKVDNATKDLYTALHIAAKEGQDEVAGALVDHGASINATTKKGFTPLHLAAKYGHLKVAKLLLQKEAPVDTPGKNGVTPLHVASHYDHQNVALLLLEKGASPHATAKNGHTPLHIAARKNQMDIANTLLEYGAHANAESKAGFTPLHLSAQEGHVEMSSLLLEHKANSNYEAKNGLTPLHLCAQEDKVPVAEVLVKNGAKVNSATNAGYTPLHIACHYGQTNMVRFLLRNGAEVKSPTSLGYTPLHQAAQQGHTNIVNILLENKADPNAVTMNGQTPLNIAQKLGYITVIETLKLVTTITNITTTTTTTIEEKYKVQAPEAMQETFMSDSEEEGGEDTGLGDQTYRYLTADEMKSLGDDSLPIDVTRDERIDSNKTLIDSNNISHLIEESISPEHVSSSYTEYIKKYTPDNVDINRHPIHIGKLHWKNFLVSFLVDARGGAMRGCRHSGVRVIVPPRCASSPTRITCRYVRPQRTPHPPPLMEGEALASRVLELGPVGAKFLGPVIIEVPHFAALRGKEREIVILRSDNGESWKEHTVDATEEILNDVLHESFEAEDLNQLEDVSSGRITRIVTQDFPQYFAVVSRVRQEVHAIGPEGGMVSSTVVPQVQAIFPEGALTKKIKVGLQAQPIDPELTAKLLGHGVAVSPVVTVEPRRRKFHKAIRLNMPAPTAHSQGMINQYSGSAPTLRLLCSITGGTTRAQWEDVTGSTPLTFVNDVVSFTTTVSARFWLMDCRNIADATKMATELYKEAIHVPFMAKFVVFAKRVDPLEARLRVFCMTDDKEDKTLEHQEHFTEVAKSRDVEVLEGKPQFIEFAGNLVPITKSGEQLQFSFRAFRENRLPFSVRVKDQHAEAVGRCLFMKEAKVPKGEPPQQPICVLNIVLPEDIVTDTISLTDSESGKRHMYLSEFQDYYRPDPRLADMSNLLGEDWVELARQLGLTSSEINVIKSEYPESVAKQAQSMLRMWLSQSGNKAQTNTLENALRRIGREDIIPQCLNVEQPSHTFTSIKEQEIGYRLKRKTDKDHADKKIIDHYDKYSGEEKAVEKSESEEEDNFDRTVTERREQIQKRLSAERVIPASAQRREIVQEISDIKRQSFVEDKIAEVEQKVDITKPYYSETLDIKTTLPSESKVPESITHKYHEETSTHIPTGNARFVEEVSSRFDGPSKGKLEQRTSREDPQFPSLFKTPPPSPADFSAQKQHEVSLAQDWDSSRRRPAGVTDPDTLQRAAQQEISCQLTSTESALTTSSSPQPKPRATKPDMPLEFARTQLKPDKIVSPVRDDLLDNEEDDVVSYSQRKQFWENVSKEGAQKRFSLHEVSGTEKISTKKRVSVHEIDQPPIPKPRSLAQVSSEPELVTSPKKSIAEIEFDREIEEKIVHAQEEVTSIIEGIENAEKPGKIVTEYQASFTPPIDRKEKFRMSQPSCDSQIDSVDSDKAQKGSSQLIEHAGYISDSEDVENVISDSEIEDRVPQIRERQMSVFSPPVTQRKTIYERSASLPTEDLYVVSNNLKTLKEKYEQKIKEDLIEEQFVVDNDEECSPERKTLALLQEERISAVKSMVDEAMAKISEDTEEVESFKPIKPEDENEEQPTKSVKDIARSYEKQISIESTRDNSTVSKSMEIHFDKSETEGSEKITEIACSSAIRQSLVEMESPIKLPEQHIHDTLWETTVETQPNFEEKVDPIVKQQIDQFIVHEKQHSVEEDEYSQVEYIIKKQAEINETQLGGASSIKENISEKLTKEIQEKLNEKLKAQDIMIEKAVSEEVDDKNLDELKELMLEEALEELQQQKSTPQDKDEDFSSGLREESDLGSEIHLDHSDSIPSERVKSESHNEIEKIILDTFEHMKVDPDDAKKIASQLIEEIESEIQNRGELSRSEASEQSKVFDPEMMTYIKKLAETNGLDDREVELVESVLARRQRELAKLARGDTQASSLEITDEDLRYSGGELTDYTHTLEQQMGQLEAERIDDLGLDYELGKTEDTFQETRETFEKLDEKHKSGQSFTEDSKTYYDSKFVKTKKDISISLSDSVKGERSFVEHKNVIMEEDEAVSEASIEDYAKVKTLVDTAISEAVLIKTDDKEISDITTGVIKSDSDFRSNFQRESLEIKSEKGQEGFVKEQLNEEEQAEISGQFSSKRSSREISDDSLKESEVLLKKEYEEQIKEDKRHQKQEVTKLQKLDDGSELTTNTTLESQHFTSTSAVTIKDKTSEKTVTTTSTTLDEDDLAKFLEDDKFTSIQQTETIHRTSSSESKSSVESSKSPDKKFEPSSKEHVILRRSKTDADSSSSSSNLKPDRKSTVDIEAYSSSGESYYQSFELDSGKSRPCSSDVEGIVAAASSEYDTALTSTQEYSAKSHVTSTDYHTAISSLSSKESMKSLDSESSGNLASVEISEHSETLVPSTSDLDGDILDSLDQHLLEDTEHSSDWIRHAKPLGHGTDFTDSDMGNESIDVSEEDQQSEGQKSPDGSSKMKRSAEMTFQPEPKVLAPDSPQNEKYGQSLDDGSILSMSVSSTTSSTGAQRTVIELSDRHISLEETELSIRGSQESLPLTPTLQKSYDMATSTPPLHPDLPIDQVTITTSSIEEDGIFNASTQITSESIPTTHETPKPLDESRRKGHRRTESTMIGISLPRRMPDMKYSSEEKGSFEGEELDRESSFDVSSPRSLSDRVEPEIADVMKSPETTEKTDPIERPFTPEPLDISNIEIHRKRDSHGKSSSTSSEKSSFEEAEAEAAFNMVAHISPAHKVKQIVPILEDEDAEKHELELKEKQQKELERKRAEMRDISSGDIPNITVTDMTPDAEDKEIVHEDSFEEIVQASAIQEQTQQKVIEKSPSKDDIVDDILTSSMMRSSLIESTITDTTTSDAITIIDQQAQAEKDGDSQSSDSFEMLEKPDIIDDFVVIEEVGKEAQEFDMEGKSVNIERPIKKVKKHDEEVEKYLAHSAPTPLTGTTGTSLDEFGFEFEDSPPRPEGSGVASTREYGYEYDKELEANKKWIEQQFQGDQAAMIAAGYGYEMEFERGPLEDIKEEDINDFAASSFGSQKESGGSIGSIKDSYSSTPDYDVLAGRKYFTRSGDQDDISMNSLQEFEKLEQAMSLEMRKFHQGQASDSSSSGSSKNRTNKNNTGDDISANSLKEFERLEFACIQAHKIEVKAKEEEALLSQIEEGQESIASESESCETTGTEKKPDDDEEDYEKRMFEIDAIIKQAQTNVERFMDLKELEKTESLGRGDSIEEVSKVPDLELDVPVVKSTIKVQWKENEDVMITSSDSLDLKREEERRDSTDSLDAPPVPNVMTASTDSIEFQVQKSKDTIMTDSIEMRDEKRDMVSSDSLELGQATSSGLNVIQTDSMEEDGSRIGGQDHSSASTGKDFSSSAREEMLRDDPMQHSVESMDPTSSTATHATMQYETDSLISGSFTSGGSNTMVSSTDTIEPTMVDVGAAARKVWFDDQYSGRRISEYAEEFSRPFVTETIEPLDDDQYSHIIHRKVELPPEMRKITFTGPDANEQMRKFMQDLEGAEGMQEFEEIDEHGNVHTKRIVQKHVVIKGGEEGLPEDIEDYFRQLNQPEMMQGRGVITHSTTLTKTVPGDTEASDEQPGTSSKPETEEHQSEKPEKEQSKRVADQHQLSEEMKELLKEMEKESKK